MRNCASPARLQVTLPDSRLSDTFPVLLWRTVPWLMQCPSVGSGTPSCEQLCFDVIRLEWWV